MGSGYLVRSKRRQCHGKGKESKSGTWARYAQRVFQAEAQEAREPEGDNASLLHPAWQLKPVV